MFTDSRYDAGPESFDCQLNFFNTTKGVKWFTFGNVTAKTCLFDYY